MIKRLSKKEQKRKKRGLRKRKATIVMSLPNHKMKAMRRSRQARSLRRKCSLPQTAIQKTGMKAETAQRLRIRKRKIRERTQARKTKRRVERTRERKRKTVTEKTRTRIKAKIPAKRRRELPA